MSARIFSPPYGKNSISFKENISIFVLWVIGIGLAMGMFVVEIRFRRCRAEAGEIRKVNRAELIRKVAKFIRDEDANAVNEFELLFRVCFPRK